MFEADTKTNPNKLVAIFSKVLVIFIPINFRMKVFSISQESVLIYSDSFKYPYSFAA